MATRRVGKSCGWGRRRQNFCGNNDRSSQGRKIDRTRKTDAPCCGSFRTTGGCGTLWPSLFVVDDDMLPLFVLLLPAGDVVLLLSPARSIPIICSFVQREYNSNIYLLEFMYLVLATIISRVGVSRFVRV